MSEHAEQVAVVQWAAWHAGQDARLLNLLAVPNGGDRHPAVAAKLKAEGVSRGVPDLFLAIPSQSACGLWVEMKTATGRVSPDQRDWHERLRSAGYRVAVCRSADEAIGEIRRYLRMGKK